MKDHGHATLHLHFSGHSDQWKPGVMLQITWVDHSDWKILSCFSCRLGWDMGFGWIWWSNFHSLFQQNMEGSSKKRGFWFDMFQSHIAAKSDPNPQVVCFYLQMIFRLSFDSTSTVLLIHFFAFEYLKVWRGTTNKQFCFITSQSLSPLVENLSGCSVSCKLHPQSRLVSFAQLKGSKRGIVLFNELHGLAKS